MSDERACQAAFVAKALAHLEHQNCQQAVHYTGSENGYLKSANKIVESKSDAIPDCKVTEEYFTHQFEKLRIENLTNKLRLEVNEVEEIKQSNAGTSKTRIRSELAEKSFARRKFIDVNKKLVDDKFEEHVISQTGPLLVASIINEGIAPIANGKECWEHLKNGMKSFRS